jgi:hypothetical protein
LNHTNGWAREVSREGKAVQSEGKKLVEMTGIEPVTVHIESTGYAPLIKY